jgi:hypothetical protein
LYGDDVFCNAVLKPYDGPKPWPRWLQKVDETVTRFTYRNFGSLFGMDITPASLVPAMEKGRWISMSEYGESYAYSDKIIDFNFFVVTAALSTYKLIKTSIVINYSGGAYSEVPKNGGQNHHMPADSVSPLPKEKGPVINMSPEDHMKTASWGSGRDARQYRKIQENLIKEGKFLEAQNMDIKDVQSKFGTKYNSAIKEMQDYTHILIENGELE